MSKRFILISGLFLIFNFFLFKRRWAYGVLLWEIESGGRICFHLVLHRTQKNTLFLLSLNWVWASQLQFHLPFNIVLYFLKKNTQRSKFSKLKKMFFRLVTSVGQRKNFESPWGMEPQTFGFALRCSTTEPQRLSGERGLLRSSNDTRPAYC